MKLTKLKALWLCHELWFWLSKNPRKDKHEWPEWSHNKGEYNANSYCFACEYNHENDNKNCNKCILFKTWKQTKLIDIDAYQDYCYERKSPFNAWDKGKNKTKNAKIISDSSYKEYKRIGGKKAKLK